jgi:bifunctional DNA-binding transcriptional regulator/antitoxin component of YhaV-PrlF toxin-antitoxin module
MKTFIKKITKKGVVILPKKLRQMSGVDLGGTVLISINATGIIEIKPAKKTWQLLEGALKDSTDSMIFLKKEREQDWR